MDEGRTSKAPPFRPWEDTKKDDGRGRAPLQGKPSVVDKGKGRELQPLPLPPILKKRKRDEIVVVDDGMGDPGYWSNESEVFGEGWKKKIRKSSTSLTLARLVALPPPTPLLEWKAVRSKPKAKRPSTITSYSSKQAFFHPKPPSYPAQTHPHPEPPSSASSARHVAFESTSTSNRSPSTPPTSDSDFKIMDPHHQGIESISSTTDEDAPPRPVNKTKKRKQPSSSSSSKPSSSKPPSYPPPPGTPSKRPISLSSSPEPVPIPIVRRKAPVPLATKKTSKAPVKARSKPPTHNPPQRLGGLGGGGYVPPPPELAASFASGSGSGGGGVVKPKTVLELAKEKRMGVAGPSRPKPKAQSNLSLPLPLKKPKPSLPVKSHPRPIAPRPAPPQPPHPQAPWPPRPAAVVVAPPSQWSCPECTFFNDNVLWECEMCETARP